MSTAKNYISISVQCNFDVSTLFKSKNLNS